MKGHKILKFHSPKKTSTQTNKSTNPKETNKQTESLGKTQGGRKQQLSNIKDHPIARRNKGQPFPSWLMLAWLAKTH